MKNDKVTHEDKEVTLSIIPKIRTNLPSRAGEATESCQHYSTKVFYAINVMLFLDFGGSPCPECRSLTAEAT